MPTAALTVDELRREVEAVLRPYGITVDDFVAADVDEVPSDELHVLWLIVRGAITPAA